MARVERAGEHHCGLMALEKLVTYPKDIEGRTSSPAGAAKGESASTTRCPARLNSLAFEEQRCAANPSNAISPRYERLARLPEERPLSSNAAELAR